jgi:ribosomal protein S12 methylthiotransferase
MKIAEGCDNRCTYCTIPSLRGKYRSRTMESLIKEAEGLVMKGVREIILVAQDTALYGRDLYGKSMLHELVKKLSEIEYLEWIRVLYAYPEHITDEFIDEMARNPKLCHYIDMPVQHSEDKILNSMKRQSNRKKLIEVIHKLRAKVPDIAIRSTLIVGFPGETLEDFNGLCEFVQEIKFDRLGVFTYSKEEGTPASIMEDQIEEEEKIKRKEFILEIQKGISAEKCSEKIGKTLKVIVEGKVEDGVYCGRSYMDCYEIDGLVFFNSGEEIIAGDFKDILIKESSDYDLIGEISYEFAQ